MNFPDYVQKLRQLWLRSSTFRWTVIFLPYVFMNVAVLYSFVRINEELKGVTEWGEGKYQEALPHLIELNKLMPGDYNYELGDCYLRTGHIDLAEKELTLELVHDEDGDGGILERYDLGLVSCRKGNVREARTQWSFVLAHAEPGTGLAKAAARDLAKYH